MAKDKKRQSIVGNKFPTPEEARKRTGEILGETEPEESRKPGRPKKNRDPNIKRTSMIVDQRKMHELKTLALTQKRHAYELLDEAITEYLEKNK